MGRAVDTRVVVAFLRPRDLSLASGLDLVSDNCMHANDLTDTDTVDRSDFGGVSVGLVGLLGLLNSRLLVVT